MLIDSSLTLMHQSCSADDVQKRTAGNSRTSLLALCEHEIDRAREREKERDRDRPLKQRRKRNAFQNSVCLALLDLLEGGGGEFVPRFVVSSDHTHAWHRNSKAQVDGFFQEFFSQSRYHFELSKTKNLSEFILVDSVCIFLCVESEIM